MLRPPVLKHFLFALLAGFALLCDAQNQSGFISIDCGLQSVSSYTEKETGLEFFSDQKFIDTGECKSSLVPLKIGYQPYATLRSFPQGNRNCYKIKVAAAGTKYLIRAGFWYGNYDTQDRPPTFDLYMGNDLWDSVKFANSSVNVHKEVIHIPPREHVLVCLVSTGQGIPFISTIQLRPLDDAAYNQTPRATSLAYVNRWNVGSDASYRYLIDVHDRFWDGWQPDNSKNLSTALTIDSKGTADAHYDIPSEVMTTAAVPVANASLRFLWPRIDRYIFGDSEYYIYMHFAEIELLHANQTREFNIFYGGDHLAGPISPPYLQTKTVCVKIPFMRTPRYFAINKTKNSTLPPILNALEIYTAKELSLRETNQQDVDAITNVKSTYGLKRNWQGDPCLPKEYTWEGLKCSYGQYDEPPRIISLNLSSSELTGVIASSIANLTMIQTLDLSNNKFTGPVPEFLSQLQSLRVLNLENNQLKGPVPAKLMEKWKKDLLELNLSGNPNICASVSCKKNHSMGAISIVAAVVGSSIFLLAIAATIWWGLLRNRHGLGKAESTIGQNYLASRKRQFTYNYSDILRITNNFERVIGKGGFGTVYHGYLDDTQVAVKVLSPSSVQGHQQFQAEVNILMRVHHKNLTALVGYFTDENNTGLIYEYMANGDLQSHLSADNSPTNILSWEDRLRIAKDAAQGLEYLHHGCKPPIIHRDVKPANILLDEKFQAKLSDFGISKTFPTDTRITHVSTVVAGTLGYLDPQYYRSNRLNEKSDVYSFGMALLEIITGRQSQSTTNLSEWVILMLEKGIINSIIDPRLQENFHVNSAWKAVEIAINCVSLNSAERPTMTQVVGELKECLEDTKIAYAKKAKSRISTHQTIPLNLLNHDIFTEPSAR